MPIPVPATQYRTLAAPDPSQLDAEVNDALRLGWSLWGSPYAQYAFDLLPCYYCQAMVLLKEDA